MAQQQQQSGGGSGGDNSMAPVYLVGALFVIGYIVWALFKAHIIRFLFTINIWEAKLVSLFITSDQLNTNLYIMETVDPATVSWAQFMQISTIVGSYIRYPVIAVFIIFAFWLYKSNVTLKFRRTHSMKSLRLQEQINWPAIMPVIKEDLSVTDIAEGPWAMALNPLEFAQKHNLLRKEDALLEKGKTELIAGIRRGDAKRVFTLQLGPYWEGFERCPMHVNCLAAVFVARIKRDRASASAILEAIDKSVALGKPDFSMGRAVLKKYQNSEEVQEIIHKHAYLLTVLASLLQAARQDGVVPSAEFLWLKTLDRRLWYMLNSIGRQTPWPEVSGPFAHWRAEQALKRKSLAPMIDEATKALEIAIKDIKLPLKVYQELQP